MITRTPEQLKSHQENHWRIEEFEVLTRSLNECEGDKRVLVGELARIATALRELGETHGHRAVDGVLQWFRAKEERDYGRAFIRSAEFEEMLQKHV